MKGFRALLVAALLVAGGSARAGVVELALLIDGSGSLGQNNWDLQIGAYQAIFGSGTFYDDFVVGGDVLRVDAWRFDLDVTNIVDADDDGAFTDGDGWFTIANNADAVAFANALDTTYVGGWTNMGGAIEVAIDNFDANGQQGARRVVDISTDGVPCLPDRLGGCPQSVAQYAVDLASRGIQTNVIGVGDGFDDIFVEPLTGATGGFIAFADDFGVFETALEAKLFREINQVPAPAGVALLGLLLLGLRRSRAGC